MRKALFKDADVIAGSCTAALGVYITLTASRWEVMGADGPGPGFFPIGYGIALIILSLILIFQRFTAPLTSEAGAAFDWEGFGRAAATWAAFAVSALAMQTAGFYIAFGVLTVFLAGFVFGKPLKTALLTGVLSAAGFYIVFCLALDVSLPVGILGF